MRPITPRPTSPSRARRGFALGLAIFALVLVGALIAGTFFASMQEYRMGRNTLVQQRALTAAELGLDTVYSQWDKRWNGSATGATVLRTYAPSDGSIDTVRITKLNQYSFLVTSEGRAGGTLKDLAARRRASMLVRLDLPQIKTLGAITTKGNVTIGGSTALRGRDTVFPGWDCPPAGPAVAGAAIPSLTNLRVNGGCAPPVYTCINGSPLISVTSQAADTSTYFNFGSQNWNSLVAMRDKVAAGTLTHIKPSLNADGTCNTGDNFNWGDPNRATPAGACESYFPIVYAPGDVSINGDVGQGILLVAGNLTIQGGFNFYGQVIVRGTVKLTGNGNHINGAVMAANVVDSTNASLLSGNSAIQYSRCTLNQVLSNNAPPSRARQRSWAELF
jgi:Tfp pilus assembly protein PilX